MNVYLLDGPLAYHLVGWPEGQNEHEIRIDEGDIINDGYANEPGDLVTYRLSETGDSANYVAPQPATVDIATSARQVPAWRVELGARLFVFALKLMGMKVESFHFEKGRETANKSTL